MDEEVFNLRLRCHNYEKKLAEIGLSGANGESLQSENRDLKLKLREARMEIETKMKENQNITSVCVKARGAIEALKQSIMKVNLKCEELNSKVSMKDAAYQKLKAEKQLLRKEMNNLKVKNADAEMKEVAFNRLFHDHQELKKKTIQLQTTVTELSGANQEKIVYQKEYEDSTNTIRALKKNLIDLESKQLEQVKIHSRELEIVKEKLGAINSKNLNLINENEHKSQCIARSKSLLAEQKNRILQLEIDLKNSRIQQESDNQKINLIWEEKMSMQAEEHQNILREVQKANTENLYESRHKWEAEEEESAVKIKSLESQVIEKNKKILRLEENLNSIKKKWLNSITHKKQIKQNKFEIRKSFRGRTASCSRLRQDDNLSDVFSVRSNFKSDNSENESLLSNRRARSRTKKATIPVRSRFMDALYK